MLKKAMCFLLALAMLMCCACAEEQWYEEIEPGSVVVAQAETGERVDTIDPEDLPDEWWNILLLGSDSRVEGEYARTDSMIILSVNPAKGGIKLTSLMRDTWVKVPGSNSHRKLTELCALGGPEHTMAAINENFDMNIEHYAHIGMEAIAEVIDRVGGIELDVTEAERKALNKGLFDLSPLSGMEKLQHSGEQVHLNGNQATAFARIRQIDSDFVRTERQRTVLVTLGKKIMNNADAGTLISIVTSLLGYIDTNLNLLEIMDLAGVALSLDLDSVEELRLPADGTYDAGTFSGVWCIKPNFNKNIAILQDFIYGDD